MSELDDLRAEVAELRRSLEEVRDRDRLRVQRIDVVEPDGTLRLAISNRATSPGIAIDGRVVHPEGSRAGGMIFYAQDGAECGGMGFTGTRSSIAFDRRDSDQTLLAYYDERDGAYQSGWWVLERPDDWVERALAQRSEIEKLPEPERSRALDAPEREVRLARVHAGRRRDGTAEVSLADAEGRPRLRLSVGSTGDAAIEILDESGQVTRRI